MYKQSVDCGNNNAVRLDTESQTKLYLAVDRLSSRSSVAMNFSQTTKLIGHLQDWIDDNPEGEICELNEDIAAGDLLNGHQSRSNDHGS